METAYLNRPWLIKRMAKEMWEDRERDGIMDETGTG
jgi:hypothetical protein